MLAGCGTTPPTISENTSTFSLIANQTTKYPYTRKMTKPAITEMTNWDALQNGFHDVWKTTYQPTTIDLADPTYKEQCFTWWFDIKSAEDGTILKNIPFKSFKNNTTLEITGTYNGVWLWLEFSQQQKDFFAQHGRMISKANSGFSQEMIAQTSYESDGSRQWGEWDERATNHEKIGGINSPYKRYPYNTILVTSDLLLHIYHRLFDNSLKFYEESVARPMLTQLSTSLFQKFIGLAKNTKDSELKQHYEFLAAYRSIPYSILIPNDELINTITTNANENPDSADITDEQIQTIITKRQQSLLKQLTPRYQKPVQDTLKEILAASNSEGKNILLETLSPNLLTSFTWFDGLKFDYTQFKPRAHYTTDSLLKTYFIGMKRLMREKLFFADKQVTTAALIMINNIKNAELKQFNEFYTFIQKLIGEDDDVNITDIQKFITTQWRKSDKDIIGKTNENTQTSLQKLRPQKIMSVSYSTPGVGDVTEQKAKDITAGFIFFWEKFTIDSRFFDQFTAGSAEKESEYKPRVQSALMVADNLINTPVTQKFAALRLEKNQTAFGISSSQRAGYNTIKWNVSKNTILTTFDFWSTVYHTRLNILATLFIDGGKNIPYFMEDALYQNKILNTYLGSYTELKHDTLLYIKQAYAEMWGGGEWPCTFTVEPPALPVPKWYVEASPDLIDQLLAITKETNKYFTGEQYTQYLDYLQFVKKIAVAQTKNQKISDEDFDQLRLAAQTLYTIATPTKLFGYALQKEKRWSIIADIFTSGKYGPLYEAVGRPYLMTMMIKDTNGARIAIGPIFSHYEFYAGQASFEAVGGGRLTDQDRQNNYDGLKWANEKNILSLPLKEILQTITP